MRPVASIGLAVVFILALAPGALGQHVGTVLLPTGTVRPCHPTEGAHLAFVQGDRLQAAYDLLLEQSPTFAAAMTAIESANGMRIRIGYREDVMPRNERLLGEDRAGAVFLADGGLFPAPGTILCGVRVVVFTKLLEEELVRAGVPEHAIVLDLALMIAHEVFGHLVPFAEQEITAWPTPCRDPHPRRAARTTGCAVDRENLIRQELSVPERASYAHVDGPLLCELTGRACRLLRPGIAGGSNGERPGPVVSAPHRPAPPTVRQVATRSPRLGPPPAWPAVVPVSAPARAPTPALTPAPAPAPER